MEVKIHFDSSFHRCESMLFREVCWGGCLESLRAALKVGNYFQKSASVTLRSYFSRVTYAKILKLEAPLKFTAINFWAMSHFPICKFYGQEFLKKLFWQMSNSIWQVLAFGTAGGGFNELVVWVGIVVLFFFFLNCHRQKDTIHIHWIFFRSLLVAFSS